MVKEKQKVKSTKKSIKKTKKVSNKLKNNSKKSIKSNLSKTNKKKSVSKNNNLSRLMHKYYKPIIALFMFAILIGSVHGFYMSYLRDKRHQYYYGSELCNGELISGDVLTSDKDESLSIYYQAIIRRGKVIFTIWDDKGEVVTRFNDWEDMLRQKVIRLDRYDSKTFSFSMECEKAEVYYELELNVK